MDDANTILSRQDTVLVDNAETVYISSLALLKMLRHGRAGVPMEVMGLMLGEFVDDYTVRVVDVFAMPQSGTGVSVEAVDPVFQTKMMDMLRQTGRSVTQSHRARKTFDTSQTGDRRRMVPLSPRFRMLALFSRYQHTAIVRTTHTACCRRRRGSHSISQGQSRHRCFPTDQPSNTHDGSRTASNHIQHWSPQQAFYSSSHPRSQQALLQHRDQLQEDWPGGEHAHEPSQARLDGGTRDE